MDKRVRSMVPAIVRQAEAERERRAKVIHAEGELQTSRMLLQAAGVPAQKGGAMPLRCLPALTRIAGDKSTAVIFSVPMEAPAKLLK